MAEEAEDDLALIPRSVRDKLDRVGIKLHLRDWEKLTMAERRSLVTQPCDTLDEVDRYRQDLEEVIRRRTGKSPDYLPRRS